MSVVTTVKSERHNKESTSGERMANVTISEPVSLTQQGPFQGHRKLSKTLGKFPTSRSCKLPQPAEKANGCKCGTSPTSKDFTSEDKRASFVHVQDNVGVLPQPNLKDKLGKRGCVCSFIVFKRACLFRYKTMLTQLVYRHNQG